jgi:predicted nucleic acid-binding protein
MQVIVSDTSPIRYLVLIEEVYLLEKLYGHILIPDTVAKELTTERTPPAVRDWMQAPPPWVEIKPLVQVVHDPISSALHPGERQAIHIALQLQADLVLMDDRAGVEDARRLGLTVTGTLGILARDADLGWINLRSSLDRLSHTNFRAHPRLVAHLLQAHSEE